jgi:ribosomal protein L16 Arg81 hydroxylase
MSLRLLLPDDSLRRFMTESFLKLPYARTGFAHGEQTLCGREAFLRACMAEGADLVVAREGQLRARPQARDGPAIEAALAEGWTVSIRQAQRHDPGLAELAAGFADDLLGPVDVHLYATPAGGRGFGWHYDAEEVFLIQLEGTKEYSLRKNTVNPWPIVETLPRDMHYEREIMPLLRCTLAPGDWLYVPAGYWHMGRAASDCLTAAVGVMMPPALAVLEYLRALLVDSLLWRQRLPVAGAAQAVGDTELLEQLRSILAGLADDVARALAAPQTAADFLRWLRVH